MKCEVCHHPDHYAGVAAVPGFPVSISWCRICLGMYAMPDFYWKALDQDPAQDLTNVRYNPVDDRYYLGPNAIDIELKLRPSGKVVTFKHRGEVRLDAP